MYTSVTALQFMNCTLSRCFV